MNAPATASDRVRDFVAAVAAHFEDLPERERAELLEDLESHLLEVAAEGDAHLDAELSSPAAYAEELRRSAGLPERRRTLADRTLGLLTRQREHPGVQAVLGFLPQLRPAWWVLRGWAAVTVVAFALAGGSVWRHVPVPGRHPVGLLLLAVAVVLSVRLGLSGADRNRLGSVADRVLAVVIAGVALALVVSSPVSYVYLSDGDLRPPVLSHPDGEPITNLYLFDLDGNPVTDVLVYDGGGRPVEIGDLDAAGFWHLDSNVRRDRSGNPVRNLYPLEQYLLDHSGRAEVRRLRDAPQVQVPDIGVPGPAPQPTVDGSDGRR